MEGFGSMAMARGLEDALREAESMGRVETGLEMVPAILFAIIGFICAYFIGPFLFR